MLESAKALAIGRVRKGGFLSEACWKNRPRIARINRITTGSDPRKPARPNPWSISETTINKESEVNPIWTPVIFDAVKSSRKKCPHCKKVAAYPRKRVGQFHKCKRCGHRFKEKGQ